MTNDLGYIERRAVQALQHFSNRNMESCGLELWPAVDNTGKRRHGGGVGSRIKQFLNECAPMISFLATRNIILMSVSGRTVFDDLYDLARCSIVHEGRDSPNVQWTFDGSARVTPGGTSELPADYMFGVALSVITAPENVGCAPGQFDASIQIAALNGKKFELKDLWGQEEMLYEEISAMMQSPIRRQVT